MEVYGQRVYRLASHKCTHTRATRAAHVNNDENHSVRAPRGSDRKPVLMRAHIDDR